MSSPASLPWPASGSPSPATMRSTVLLPQPDGPRRERNSPGAASRDTSSTATTAPNALRSRETLSAGAAPLTAGDALPARRGSTRDLAPPALRPLGELPRHEVGVGEVHALDDVAKRHELSQIGRELDLLVVGAADLLLREAELALRREEGGDILLGQLALLAGLGNGDGGHDADGALLGVGRRHRHALRRGGAGAVRVPHRHRDITPLEQRDNLVGLRVHHLDIGLELLDRLEAGIDVLDRPPVEARRRHQELLSRG